MPHRPMPEQWLSNVHRPEQCAGRACVIHRPSDHHMRGWPLTWRNDTRVMERTCPHGIGHPDPDHVAADRARFGEEVAATNAVHGCDGCCTPPQERRFALPLEIVDDGP